MERERSIGCLDASVAQWNVGRSVCLLRKETKDNMRVNERVDALIVQCVSHFFFFLRTEPILILKLISCFSSAIAALTTTTTTTTMTLYYSNKEDL